MPNLQWDNHVVVWVPTDVELPYWWPRVCGQMFYVEQKKDKAKEAERESHGIHDIAQ